MSIIDILKNLINKFGDWISDLFKTAQDLYDDLTDAEKTAAQWGSGVIAIVNNAIDKTPQEIKDLISKAYPDLSLDQLHGFLEIVLNKIGVIQNQTPLTLEDALSVLQNYLKGLEGNTWQVISQTLGNLLAVLFSPSTPVQKFIGVAELVYNLFVKPHVEADSIKPPVANSDSPYHPGSGPGH